jgi:ABC-type uncharacterized transport system permease subunit
LIADQFTSNIVIHTFGYKIQDGSLSGELVRPIHPMLTNALVNNIAFKMLTIMGLIPIWIILFFLFKPDFSGISLSGIALAIPAMVLAFFIRLICFQPPSLRSPFGQRASIPFTNFITR